MAAKERTGKNKDKDLVLGCKNYSLRKAPQSNKLQDNGGRPFIGKSDKASHGRVLFDSKQGTSLFLCHFCLYVLDGLSWREASNLTG